jgi:hypothetical protein
MVAAISGDSGTFSSSIKYECDTVARRGPITKQGILVRWVPSKPPTRPEPRGRH